MGGSAPGGSGRTAVIVIGEGYQEHEFWFPYYRLLEADFSVVVAGLIAETVYGEGTIFCGGMGGTRGLPASITHSLDEVLEVDFDLLYLPGGLISPMKLRGDRRMRRLVRTAVDAGRVVGAICHASWILIDAGMVDGRRVAAPLDMACDVRNAGGIYEEGPCVTDGTLVTATFYSYLPQQFRSIMMLLQSRDHYQREDME